MKTLTFTLFFLLASQLLTAQITTSKLNGRVKDNLGKPIEGATVNFTFEEIGLSLKTSTNKEGRFAFNNLRVGGPYKLEITHTGFNSENIENISLVVGEEAVFNITMSVLTNQLSHVVVQSSVSNIFKNSRTGLSTTISPVQLKTIPSITRSLQDFTNLVPSSSGFSFAGRNSQFNNFTLDGAVFNNPFGLDAATPGGQTDANPISLDAIDQIQVNIAPYDVTQSSFTGAAINTVTKSGTNKTKGTAYVFYRNQDLTGGKVAGTNIKVPDLTQLQAGFSVGGPIVKNKLFYFLNFELDNRTDLGSNYLANRGTSGPNVSRVLASDLELVYNALKGLGYESGKYENYLLQSNSTKGIFKLDYIISPNYSITGSINFLDAFKDKTAHPDAINRRGPDLITLQFQNAGYRITNQLYNINFEFKARFSDKVSNKFKFIYTDFNDFRTPNSTPAPVINIYSDGVPYIIAGHEPFSIHNIVLQKTFQITDNLTIFLKNNTLSIGGSFEKFSFDNSFNLFGYGSPFGGYASTGSFLDSVRSGEVQSRFNFAKAQEAAGLWNKVLLDVGQASTYIQDELAVKDNLKLTFGIRFDVPLYFNSAKNIPNSTPDQMAVNEQTYIDASNGTNVPIKLDHTKLPDLVVLVSPRFGFNYDIKGDRSLQLRGGTGLFTGRFPFVWISNQLANPNWYYLNVTAPNFKWPQVWRTNLGLDIKLPKDYVLSLDAVYTKDVNAMFIRNYGLGVPTGRLNNSPDKRAIYQTGDFATIFGSVPLKSTYVFTNTDIGSSFNFSAQVQKQFKNGLFLSLAYNFLLSYDASSIPSEISGDAFDRNPALGNVNVAVSAPSLFGNLHKVIFTGSKRFEYKKYFSTTVSVFYQLFQGGRYSYTYSGDINNDGSALNDLIYIPTASELNQTQFSGTAAAQADQRAAFEKFIQQDEYLNSHRGQYMEKYGILTPFYGSLNLKVVQEFKINQSNSFQLSMDVLNVGNLINSNWGVRQIPVSTQPIGVSVDASGTPIYSFDKFLTSTYQNDFSLLSRWQIQFGIRYIF